MPDSRSFSIRASLDLPADAFEVKRAGLDWFKSPPASVTLKVGYDDQEMTQLKAGMVDEMSLSLNPDSIETTITGRDRVGDLVDKHVYMIFYLVRPEPEQQPKDLFNNSIDYSVGEYTVRQIAAEVVAKAGLSLHWETLDWPMLKEGISTQFEAFGPAMQAINSLLGPIQQTDMYKTDVFADGNTIYVKRRRGIDQGPAEYSYVYTDARLSQIQVTKRRLKGTRLVTVEDYDDDAATKDDCGKIVETTEIVESVVTLMGGAHDQRVITRSQTVGGVQVKTQRDTYLYPHFLNASGAGAGTTGKVGGLVTSSYVEYAYDIAPGARAPDGRCAEGRKLLSQRTITYQYVITIFPRLLSQEKHVSTISLIEQTITYHYKGETGNESTAQTTSNVTFDPTTHKVLKEETNTTTTTKITKELSSVRMEINSGTEGSQSFSSVTVLGGGMIDTSPVPKIRNVESGGKGFSGYSLPGIDVSSSTNKTVDITSLGLPKDLSKKIANEILSQEGKWEYTLSLTYRTMPWIRKGTLLQLTGLIDDGEGGTFDLSTELPVFLVTENSVDYIEDSETPELRGTLAALGWRTS